ncbi:unnamed protein product, partial [Prorocentrum cordatum]
APDKKLAKTLNADDDDEELGMGSGGEEGEMDMKGMMKAMMGMMKGMRKDMKCIKKETEEKMASIQQTVEIASDTAGKAMAECKKVQSEVKGVKDHITKFERDLRELRTTVQNRSDTIPATDNLQTIEKGIRELQVIAAGLQEAQDEEDIIEQVTKRVVDLGAGSKHTDIFVYTDPSKIGVIQFKSIAAKIGFLKKASNTTTKWDNGSDMRFKSNDILAKRTIDKEMGKVKSLLHNEGQGYKLEDMKIKWKERVVELKGQKTWKKEGGEGLQYEGEGKTVEEAVKSFMTAWKSKRMGTIDEDL